MIHEDPLSDLLFLAEAAAQAGEDWRRKLHEKWLPGLIASSPAFVLRAWLEENSDIKQSTEEDLAESMEKTIVAILEEQGYE